MGCDKKISLDLRHRPLISPSDSWTFLPGLAPRTVEQLHNNCYKCDRHRSQGLTEIGTQWRTRTAEPRSRHGLPAAYLPRVSILCCRCSICHCLSLYRRAQRVGRDYCRAGVRGRGDSRSRRRNTMLDWCDDRARCQAGVRGVRVRVYRGRRRCELLWWHADVPCRKPDKINKIKYLFVYVIALPTKRERRRSRPEYLKWNDWNGVVWTLRHQPFFFLSRYPSTTPGNVYSSTTGIEYRPFFKYLARLLWWGTEVVCGLRRQRRLVLTTF